MNQWTLKKDFQNPKKLSKNKQNQETSIDISLVPLINTLVDRQENCSSVFFLDFPVSSLSYPNLLGKSLFKVTNKHHLNIEIKQIHTAPKMKLSFKDFVSKCDQSAVTEEIFNPF